MNFLYKFSLLMMAQMMLATIIDLAVMAVRLINGVVNKNMLIFAAGFALLWWFLFGQFNSMLGGLFGVFGQFATVAVMIVFMLVFLIVWTRFIKRPTGV